jgi:hypothetical protein
MSFFKNFFNFTVDAAVDTTKSNAIPIEANDKFNCNADWLSRILGHPIESFNIKPLSGGFTTQSYRINYTSSEENIGESSVFVKYMIPEKDMPFFSRLLNVLSNIVIEPLSRKEAFFYNHICTSFNKLGIRTPRPLYVALEDNGDLPKLFTIMGFQNDFRGVILMEDLGKCESFPLGAQLPEKYSRCLSAKLAQLHSLNWYQPIHPDFPSEYKPDAYVHFFNFNQNFLTKNLNKDGMTDCLKLWKDDCDFLNEPKIRNGLITFSEHKDILLKYNTNDKPSSAQLFQHKTFIHGDFHCANVLFITEPSQEDPETKDIKDLILIDWQCYAYGHPSTEFSYFLNNVEYDPEGDLKLMKIYYEELTKTVPSEEYPWEVFQREVEIRSLQLGITSFNMLFKYSPEDLEKFKPMLEKKGMDFDFIIKGYRSKFLRFASIMEKWVQENILERIEEF